MYLKQIEASLTNLFQEPSGDGENRKLVFWTDEEEDFANDYEKIQIEDVKMVHLHENNQFYIKHLLEEEDTSSSFLVYTTMDLSSENNWLYDIVLYSKRFYADRISLNMDELQIDASFRSIVQRYYVFFKSQERMKRFKRLEIASFSKEIIELAIMNVICKTQSLGFEAVLRTVLMDTLEDGENRYLQDMHRFFDLGTFWSYVKKEYDYNREDKSLQTLFIHLAVTAFSRTIDDAYLSDYAPFMADNNRTNVIVFMDRWIQHKTDYQQCIAYLEKVEEEIQLADVINSLSVDVFQNAEIFPYVDKAIIIYITNHLLDRYEDYNRYAELIQLRRTKQYYERFRNIYDALHQAVHMAAFKKRFDYGIPQGPAIEMYRAYEKEYFLMDTYYRKFYVAYDREGHNELLFKLKDFVEQIYTDWFMGEINAHWSQAVKQEMTRDWILPGIINQQRFFSSYIESHQDKEERAFVIISDAMRYEAGKELQERMNTEMIGACEIDTMLSVVPSVTKLGMAALLPHKRLEIDRQGDVLLNGQRSSGIENRKKIIDMYSADGMAIHADDLMGMNKANRREVCKGKKLIYIYHDAIDAVGDNAATEMDTFQAVEKAIDELSDLARIIWNDLSATNIYVTSDHGFLYQREPLKITDLTNKESINALEMKRRYILSNEQKEAEGQLSLDLSTVVDNEDKLFAYVPNATMRYRIQGAGANFVHGGASLQEIVVPLLMIKNKRTGQVGAQAVQKVDINLTSKMRRITNSIFSLNFFQSEKVADKHIPRKVTVYIADEDHHILSDEKTIIGDLTSDDPKEREFNLQFVLKNLSYDRNQTYYLIIKDMDTGVVTERIPFTIHLGMVSDFDF